MAHSGANGLRAATITQAARVHGSAFSFQVVQIFINGNFKWDQGGGEEALGFRSWELKRGIDVERERARARREEREERRERIEKATEAASKVLRRGKAGGQQEKERRRRKRDRRDVTCSRARARASERLKERKKRERERKKARRDESRSKEAVTGQRK